MRLDQYLINESINDKGIFKACFMAGTPGAGKSYVIKQIKGGVEPKIVNTDTWTEFLKALDKNAWEEQDKKIRQLTKAQLSNYLNSMLPLWIDGTSSNPPSVFRREGILKSLGYDTAMLWVNTDIETAKKRAKERHEKGGRDVDEDFIDKVYTKISKLKTYYKSQFDTFVEVSNNDGELTDEVILTLYKRMDKFFMAPVENPIGQEKIKKMKEKNLKYLEDVEDYKAGDIERLVQGWYR